MAADGEDLLPLREAARLAGVSRATLAYWVKRGLVSTTRHRRFGQLVTLAAVQAVAVARGAGTANGEYVLPSVAARSVGLPAWRVTSWSQRGTVATTPSGHGRLVCLAEVQALAAQFRERHAARTPGDGSETGKDDDAS